MIERCNKGVIRYVHGSEDSTDIDVIYVFDALPTIPECKEFCDGRGNENGNIIVVENGVTVSAFKGSVDEVNNALFHTYHLHEQDFPLIIERAVPRDVILKDIKVLRRLLSSFSRTEYRTSVKTALRSGWVEKLRVLAELDFRSAGFASDRHTSEADLLKALAFQMGQAMALHDGAELYTKCEISQYFPELKGYLYRENTDSTVMIEFIRRYLAILSDLPVQTVSEDGHLIHVAEPYNATYDLNAQMRVGDSDEA